MKETPVLGRVKLNDEPGRLAALYRYQVLDTGPERPFETVVSLIEDLLETPICAVNLLDADRQWFKARRGLDVCETARDIAFCNQTIKQAEPLIVPDAAADPRFAENSMVTGEPHIRAYAGVPLVSPDGYQIGTLCAIDTKPREFAEHEIKLLTKCAKLVVDELELRLQAGTDELTGVMSRRYWMMMVQEEIQRAARNANLLSIAMFDIDKFKRINDTYGHAFGDLVIKSVVNACLEHVRAGSKLGRLGGEEFVLLFTECALDQAVVAAERCRRAIEDIRLTAPNGDEVRVTASFGVAPLFSYSLSSDDLIELADRALYRAKHAGRNRLEVGQVAANIYPDSA
ncbi:sensor domain-containing diguanylate cyclase [Oceanicaulis alexandrii]|uniref:sensor domain-containing diguanylate cyclase n=1 Tax=Oceanicaulis alexandrii TaxID=153233 RepID=UPI0023579CB8|nr:sensor domain-containing diguanylate cyclase [Oceanicaulis alexandrii]